MRRVNTSVYSSIHYIYASFVIEVCDRQNSIFITSHDTNISKLNMKDTTLCFPNSTRNKHDLFFKLER